MTVSIFLKNSILFEFSVNFKINQSIPFLESFARLETTSIAEYIEMLKIPIFTLNDVINIFFFYGIRSLFEFYIKVKCTFL